MGCPTSYEGKTLTWSKGRLASMRKGTIATGVQNYSYTYNGFGQRIARSYTKLKGTSGELMAGELTNSSKQYFYDHSGRLIAETCTRTYNGAASETENIVYLYDESGIIGMVYTLNGATATYYFHRNLLGDVLGIYDTSGTMVAKYIYDAWGNCTISGETTNNALAHANPIRYRGYYYDDDTGLYYLNARYYSPKWRRFISPDDTSYLDPETVNGLNLYCYCGNDPVNFIDPSGHFVLTISALLTGIAIGAAVGAGTAFGTTLWADWRDDGQVFNGSIGFGQYFGNMLCGAISGAGIGACGILGVSLGISIVTSETLVVGATTLSGLTTFGISMGVTACTGALSYTARVAFNSTEEFEWSDMFIAAGANVASGLTTFIASMWRGALGYMIPGQKTSLHNLMLHQIFMVEKGGYFAKIIIAAIKKHLQEEY